MRRNKASLPDFDDIIFENHNKLYGGYLLRKTYPARLMRITLLILSLIFLCIITPEIIKYFSREDVVIFTEDILPNQNEVPPALSAADIPVNMNSNLLPEINDEEDSIRKKDSITIKKKQTTTGTNPDKDTKGKDDKGNNDGKDNNGGNYIELDKYATFHGTFDQKQSNKAKNEFIRNNFKSPAGLVVKGYIVIGCRVEQNGSLTNFTFVKRCGVPAFDDEFLRVVKLMPPWEPAMRNGHPIESDITIGLRL